ncbi:MAG: hypothetical protein ACSHX9_11940 [Luteolibacter sp.]
MELPQLSVPPNCFYASVSPVTSMTHDSVQMVNSADPAIDIYGVLVGDETGGDIGVKRLRLVKQGTGALLHNSAKQHHC